MVINLAKMEKLPLTFYLRSDVTGIAKELLGKVLVTKLDGSLTTGRIVETEAYPGGEDMASYSYNGRRTKGNEGM